MGTKNNITTLDNCLLFCAELLTDLDAYTEEDDRNSEKRFSIRSTLIDLINKVPEDFMFKDTYKFILRLFYQKKVSKDELFEFFNQQFSMCDEKLNELLNRNNL